jgi:hypothetical protein
MLGIKSKRTTVECNEVDHERRKEILHSGHLLPLYLSLPTLLPPKGAVLPIFGQSPCRKVGTLSHFTDGPAVMPVLAWTCSPHTPIALLKPKQRTLHQKTEPFAAYIEKRWQKYWIPGRYLTVDEAIQRFLGRCTEAPHKARPSGH